jgi:aminoglycoside phosphotransferase (APT) family kinase protein
MRLLEVAASAGIPVPAVVAGERIAGALGAPVFIMERVNGETIPRKILRDDAYAAARRRLTAQCGAALAGIHLVGPEQVAFLGPPVTAAGQLDQYRSILDGLGEPHPAFEVGFRWLAARLPEVGRLALVHGDFRNGNLIVGPEGLRSVIDWELAHVGDPMEDLGWFCVRAWRFGADHRPAGGFGSREELFSAYEEAGGAAVDPDAVSFWEALGTLKWGIMCIMQAFTHLQGFVRSVELAAIGRRVCEMEHDLLELIAQEAVSG